MFLQSDCGWPRSCRENHTTLPEVLASRRLGLLQAGQDALFDDHQAGRWFRCGYIENVAVALAGRVQREDCLQTEDACHFVQLFGTLTVFYV